MPDGSPQRSERRGGQGNEAIEQAALRYLARKDRTETQLHLFLQGRGVSSVQARSVVGRLRRLGYLNDEAYSRRWAADRVLKRPMGRSRLEAELLAQGFASALVDQVLNEIYGRRSERAWAEALLQAKGQRKNGLARQVQLLRMHGFSEETIEEVLRY